MALFHPKFWLAPLLVTLALIGCGSDPLVGKWKVDDSRLEGSLELRSNGTYVGSLGYPTPIGAIQARSNGDYSATQTTLTLSPRDSSLDTDKLPEGITSRLKGRVDGLSKMTQIFQIQWKDSNTIEASSGTGQHFVLRRVK